ncbi:GDP-L-fucose synthase [Candidatus Peribacteria bacterium]|nr:GDP-L-fucose synthase [Candidatus Peribacteria bacterium]
MPDLHGKRIVVTGGRGFLGRAICDELRVAGVQDIVVTESRKHDLREKKICMEVLDGADIVIHCAAHVGGIGLNAERPAEMFYDNAIMGIHLIHAAKEQGLSKVVLIGTACVYPKLCPIPLREEKLWDGYPNEETGYYGLAKKMLFVQADAYRKQYGLSSIVLIPTNLYGPFDTFDPVYGHVIPSLIFRMVEAKEKKQPTFTVWGTGKATREFLFVRDAARAIVLATATEEECGPLNLGTGEETPIRELVSLLQRIVGYEGTILWDAAKPDGQPRRCMDVSRAKKILGFTANIGLEDGLRETVSWFLEQRRKERVV